MNIRRATVSAILILLIAGLALSYQQVDDGFILSWGDHFIDPVGDVKDASNRLFRSCSEVSRVRQDSSTWNSISRQLSRAVDRNQITPRIIMTQGDWILTEADVPDAEPAIFLLLKSQTGAVTKATYGGTAAPFNEAAAIRDFFVEEVPDAPDALIKCYEPVGPPFAP
jgi:hypothetical protein